MKEAKSPIKFEEFVEKVIRPLVENYRPMNNQEEWYCHWDLIPYQGEDPDTYTKRLMEIRKDPKVTWQFKTFLLQLVSTVHYGYIKPQQESNT
jgi:hypothetical protein